MPNTPSSQPDSQKPQSPTPREIDFLYPGLDQREQLLQEAKNVYGTVNVSRTLEGKKMDNDGFIQVYLNYCHMIEGKYPAYAAQASMAFNYIDRNAAAIDINDESGELHKRYPFLGPLVTVIRNS